MRDLLPDDAEDLLLGRVQVINLWRPINHPVYDAPLAVAEAGSVRPDELVPSDLVYRNRVGETYNVLFNPAHRWHYISGQRPDEVLLLIATTSATMSLVSPRTPRSSCLTHRPARPRAKASSFAPSSSTRHDGMGYATIRVNQVTPRIGAVVSNIDLTATLSNQQVDDLHTALAEHQVLFFRDQKLTLDQHKAFGRQFGELHIHPNTPGPEGHPEILPIYADANSKRINGERWHSDVSCDPEPPMGSILNLKVVPPVGGDTIFSSMYAAYDALSGR